jgi:acetyl-CoA C-acetyltransferase
MVDPRTPVIVGVGEFAERVDDPDYRGLSPVDLAAEAVRAALRDTEADVAAVISAVDTAAGMRQFETSHPYAPAPLGRSNNYPRSVANRVGLNPRRLILEVVGGDGPQKLVNEMVAAIADGKSDVALVFGSDATSTNRWFAKRDDKPDFTETVNGELEDRGYGLEGLLTDYIINHGLVSAPTQYGVLENARRARLGLKKDAYARSMGELFAPMTRIAAKNPLSASPVERSAEELITVTADNRLICDPYPRLLVARDQVNQGAAALIMSVEVARRFSIPEEKWVYLHGHADLREQELWGRPDLGGSPASTLAVEEAVRVAGIGIDDVDFFDIYSCFPYTVFNFCDGTGVATNDPRSFTVTGGLPYFGGAGNSYSMHAIVETVVAARGRPGSYGLVVANGGITTKYSAGVYSTAERQWEADRCPQLQQRVEQAPRVGWTEVADGAATVETYTICHEWQDPIAVIVGKLDGSGDRFLSVSSDDNLITAGDLIGARVKVSSMGGVNRSVPA